MHDIFISYSRKDVARAENLAKKLEKEDFSVWWDRKIPTGRSFDEVIEKAIDDSKCVIILWSDDSVKSQWARTEADEGRRRRILVPILIEDVEIPIAFRNLQAANFIDWDNDHTDIRFVNLIKDIRSIILEDEIESGSGKDVEEPVSSLPEETIKVSTQKKTKLKTPIIVLGVIAVLALATWGISKYIPKSDDEINSSETAVNLPDTKEELEFWIEMLRINSDSSYKAYEEKYNSGFYNSIAQIKRDSIKGSQKLDDENSELSTTTLPIQYYTVTLIVPSTMSSENVYVDGQKAEILDRTDISITLRLSKKSKSHYFEIKENNKKCFADKLIDKDSMNFALNCNF